jgi:hypothetical protein
MPKVIFASIALIAIHGLIIPVAGDSDVMSCEEMIAQAPKVYYNPKRQGFGGFKATIKPNWKVILGAHFDTAKPKSLSIYSLLDGRRC